MLQWPVVMVLDSCCMPHQHDLTHKLWWKPCSYIMIISLKCLMNHVSASWIFQRKLSSFQPEWFKSRIRIWFDFARSRYRLQFEGWGGHIYENNLLFLTLICALRFIKLWTATKEISWRWNIFYSRWKIVQNTTYLNQQIKENDLKPSHTWFN